MAVFETFKDFMILLAQPRSRGHFRPGHAAFHVGDFFGDLAKLQQQVGRVFLAARRFATLNIASIVDQCFQALAQLAGKDAELGQFENRQVRYILARPAVAPDMAMDGADANTEPFGNGNDRAALEVIGLDGRPFDVAVGLAV